MSQYSKSSQKLIDRLKRLPGVGARSAERIAMHIIRGTVSDAEILSEAIRTARNNIQYCKVCFNLSDDTLCHICADTTRSKQMLCVVADPHDAASIEKLGFYKGLYHILQGNLSPLDNVGPQDITVPQLVKRIENDDFEEVIIATGCDSNGEQTALYLSELLKPMKCKVTRIARGLPVGSSLEFADSATLRESLKGRTQV